MNLRALAILIFVSSIGFFIAGLLHPIMASKLFLTIDRDEVYLTSTVKDFFQEGEWFIASLLLLFTFILPILKYIFLGLRIIFRGGHEQINSWLEVINKWAMLDVFVLAVVIVNLKFDSLLLVTEVRIGTTFFILSILLLMLTSTLLRKAYSTH